jgi:hypothetical protein
VIREFSREEAPERLAYKTQKEIAQTALSHVAEGK